MVITALIIGFIAGAVIGTLFALNNSAKLAAVKKAVRKSK